MLTGEPVPVDKKVGTPVYGGTVNVNRILTMEVTATGHSTALAQIIAAVERAQNSRANIQRLGLRAEELLNGKAATRAADAPPATPAAKKPDEEER